MPLYSLNDPTGLENNEMLLSILNDLPFGVVLYGSQAEILMTNQAALDMLGVTEDETLGRTPYDPRWNVIYEDGQPFPPELRTVPIAMRTGQPVRDVVMGIYRPKTDDRVWVSVTAVPQLDSDGKVGRVVCSFEDITGQKFAEWALEEVNQQLEEIIAESTAHLRLLTDHATDVICLHAPDGTYLYASPSSLSIVGYTPDELIGKNPYDYIHPDDRTPVQETHDTSLDSESGLRVAYRFRKKSGDYIWLETLTRPVVENGQVVNLVTVSRDITERTRIQEELRQERDLLSSIMETSPAGITVVDKDGQVSFSNRRAGEIHGINRDEVALRSYDAPQWRHTDYDGNPWPDEKQPFVIVMNTKRPVYDVRHAIEWPDGRVVYLAINGAPLFDEKGEIAKVVFTIEDYSLRKRQQDALEEALAREKKLSEMKSRFITTVSHEFRTPMAVIMTSTGLLRTQHSHMNTEQLMARFDRIDSQVQRLDQLITDVTFINKAEMVGLRVNLMTIMLDTFFEQLVSEVQAAYQAQTQNGVSIQMSIHTSDCQIVSDDALLHQIFSNLLSNAVKYSRPGGKVTLVYASEKHQLRVQLADDGIGIPEADHAAIFDAFHRAGNVGMVSGTGIGLAVTKQAVEALGGSITFDSKVDLGTIFTVILPHKMLDV